MSRSIRLRFVIIIITQRSLVTQLVMEKKEKKEAPRLRALSLSVSGSKAALSFHDARSSSASSQRVER